MKRIIKAASGRAYEFPDVYTEVNELGYILDQFGIEVNYMERRTEDESSLRSEFGTPEQAQTYIEAVKQLESELGELYQRFIQISGITE